MEWVQKLGAHKLINEVKALAHSTYIYIYRDE